MRKGLFYFGFRPFPAQDRFDSITIPYFRKLIQANGVLTDKIAKAKSFRRRNDHTAGNNER
jgi:hypothetical protein